MKRRNWLLIVVAIVGTAGFILSRTVWGPPSRAAANDATLANSAEQQEEAVSDAKRRYIEHQTNHWRYLMLKRN